MGPYDLVLLLFLHFIIILLWPAAALATSTLPKAKPNCVHYCDNVTVPYPFGFGAKECYRDDNFRLTCNNSYNPPKLFYGELEVSDISLQGQLHVLAHVSGDCNKKSLGQRTTYSSIFVSLGNSSFTVSDTQNRFAALGCDINASITSFNDQNLTSGCSMICSNISDAMDGSCMGNGCCQTSIPVGLRNYSISLQNFDQNYTDLGFGQCSYAFLVDKNRLNSSVSNLFNFTRKIVERGYFQVPVVYDWAVDKKSCEEAMKDPTTYACSLNTVCGVSKNDLGYNCNCSIGYKGNPYLPNIGCQDIDECADLNNPCNGTCTNLPGSYKCSCPPWYHGDGRKDGSGCIPPQKTYKPFPAVIQVVIIGAGLASLFLLIGRLLALCVQKIKDKKLKQKFFKQNGGFLLKDSLSSLGIPFGVVTIFTAEEIKQTTNNYDQSQILGRGGFGAVYKGILPDHRVVAIKIPKKLDEFHVKQFINEVLILTQIHHRNVVRLLGCCLETEVPILVYEFISNKTLFHHIHEVCDSPISWDNRLRIATEAAGAIAYLHNAHSISIIHRDIKSTNILLDGDYKAKVADFGLSRLVPLNQTHISTIVKGTLGYLDPEYFQYGQFTEKSDVYSFGVVLVELLTRKKALYSDGPDGDQKCLAMHFVTSIQEGNVWDIIDKQIMTEGCKEQLQEVIELAERCLKAKGEERPTMKEVAMELEGLMNYHKRPTQKKKKKSFFKVILGFPGSSKKFYNKGRLLTL